MAMRRALLALLTVAYLSGTASAQTPAGSVLPPNVKWEETPLLPGAKIAVLYGDLAKPGLATFRVLFPSNYKVPAHHHSATENLTVISGTIYDGLGERRDPSKSTAYPAGSFFVLPANSHHSLWTTDQEAVLQVSVMGPFNMTFEDPAEDPRRK
jgi:quercetin dioxygenase-like cupin family protein